MAKFIQSFYQYPVTFSSIERTIPAKDAAGDLRNIAEFSEEEIAKLEKQEPFYRDLLNQKKIRVLNHLPESYKAPSVLVNEAQDRAAAAEAKAAELEAKLAAVTAGSDEPEGEKKDLSKMDYKALQEMARDLGIENVNIKKADLIKAIEGVNN